MNMRHDDDLLVFADDEVKAPEPASAQVWKLLVVDDEPEIHDITRLALGGLRIDGHPLAILSVSSATSRTQDSSPSCLVGASSRPGMVAAVMTNSCSAVFSARITCGVLRLEINAVGDPADNRGSVRFLTG